MLKKILKIYKDKEELWNYLISGVFGVIVSVTVYAICSHLLNQGVLISNIISWIIAVIFMYITNKIFVFKSKCQSTKKLIEEFTSFISARLLTLFIETGILYLGSKILKIDDILVKIIAQIIIIILNYILSKLWIFKKKKD